VTEKVLFAENQQRSASVDAMTGNIETGKRPGNSMLPRRRLKISERIALK
jgi:hypothetical protein